MMAWRNQEDSQITARLCVTYKDIRKKPGMLLCNHAPMVRNMAVRE